ncbi:GNAT family N-acetyltransferase [Jongsikchunia kroppenstedtii]|uniref:GNAT family N-acetyltransferase n=1 Tax=Jongsikchunia kroppenstedtii TaxID=1121721 RepID=UPI0003736F8A|nr:GNAT family N-acetyltransferase [Jongsikchunia kroppenstedtii]
MGDTDETVDIRIAPADPGSAAARHSAEAYYTELAELFPDGFDPDVGGAIGDPSITPPRGLLLIATSAAGETVGCGALTFHDAGVAEIKRVWTAPSTRGHGLGRRLVLELETRARDAGTHTLQLDTNRALTGAIAMYRRLGFTEVPRFNDNPYADYWFAKTLRP